MDKFTVYHGIQIPAMYFSSMYTEYTGFSVVNPSNILNGHFIILFETDTLITI